MRALVTGGGGHLGFNVVSLLLSRGHEVSATVRSLSNGEQTARLSALGRVALLKADVRNYEQMYAALESVDVLFHVAAVYSIMSAPGCALPSRAGGASRVTAITSTHGGRSGNEALIHEVPAIVGCRTPSALAHSVASRAGT